MRKKSKPLKGRALRRAEERKIIKHNEKVTKGWQRIKK